MIMMNSRRRMLSDMERTLSEYSVGETLKIKINGVSRDFIIIHQGSPNKEREIYDESASGVWIMSKDIILVGTWGSSASVAFDTAAINKYLNDIFLPTIEDKYRRMVKPVRIPCVKVFADGSTALIDVLTKAFPPSMTELGVDDRYNWYTDGVKFDYFASGTDSAAKEKRKAAFISGLSSSANYAGYMTRTRRTESNNILYYVMTDGTHEASDYRGGKVYGVRPIMVLNPVAAATETAVLGKAIIGKMILGTQ
jgi:hypothetical protein